MKQHNKASFLGKSFGTLLATVGWSVMLQAAPIPKQNPMFVSAVDGPSIMLAMARDHKLFFEAYDDYSDIDGDSKVDLRYKPAITYYGNFDSYMCYTYNSGVFTPRIKTEDKKCAGNDDWSGDYLNYLTTSRIDALRKVFYGGKRSTDGTSDTVLERAYIPQDAHAWGKEYTSTEVDGYNIADYTPLSQPTGSGAPRHFFANVTLMCSDSYDIGPSNYALRRSNVLDTGCTANGNATNGGANNPPLLRIMQNVNSDIRVWNWVSVERPVAGWFCNSGDGKGATAFVCKDAANPKSIQDYVVRNKACVSTVARSNKSNEECKAYGNSQKPIGLLQKYGDDDRMYFGLSMARQTSQLDGSEQSSGNAWSVSSAINLNNGTIKSNSLIKILDDLRIQGFGKNYEYTDEAGAPSSGYYTGLNCALDNRPLVNGKCTDWGNPIAEVMHDTIARLAGKQGYSPYTTSFARSNGSQKPSSRCSVPFIMPISDISLSYDSDVPGSSWSNTSSNVGFNANAAASAIWGFEGYTGPQSIFVGELLNGAGLLQRNAISAKTGDFTTIRGLAPDAPGKEGSYHAASVAYFANKTVLGDLNSQADKLKDVKRLTETIAVALAAPIPKIEFKHDGKIMTFVPMAKTTGGYFAPKSTGGRPIRLEVPYIDYADKNNAQSNSFYPTAQLVDFYITEFSQDAAGNRTYEFRVNFEDAEHGSDFDMDTITRYRLVQNGSTITATLTSESAGNNTAYQHIGFTVSGSDNDGMKLLVRGKNIAAREASSSADWFKTPMLNGSYYDHNTSNFNNNYGPGANPRNGSFSGGNVGYSDNYPAAWVTEEVYKVGTTSFNTLCGTNHDRLCDASPVSATFNFSNTPSAITLKDPLWYAAKYGNYHEVNTSGVVQASTASKKIWDKNNDGTPDSYYFVANPSKLKENLENAFNEIAKASGTISKIAANSSRATGDTALYRAAYDSDVWTGSLQAYELLKNADDSVAFNADGTVKGLISPAKWDAALKLATRVQGTGYTGRNVYTYGATDGVSFKCTDATCSNLPATLKAVLDKPASCNNDGICVAGAVDNKATDRVDYLRGKEIAGFRSRVVSEAGILPAGQFNPLGDIINSAPLYVGASRLNLTNSSYRRYQEATLARPKMVYVGANDGMLHAFDAETGEEVFTYIPKGVQHKLSALTDPSYGSENHQYFVDGSVTIHEVKFPDGQYKTVLVGGLGAGGKGYFALDVTCAGRLRTSDSACDNSTLASPADLVLWDKTLATGDLTTDPDLGASYGKPQSGKVCMTAFSPASPCDPTNIKDVLVFGNGYNSANSKAQLYVLELQTGGILARIPTKNTTSNGLSAPFVDDYDQDDFLDYVYAGDLTGDLWRFNLKDGPSSWSARLGTTGSVAPLFSAGKPITSRPLLYDHSSGTGNMVVFATGRYFVDGDPATLEQNAIYGVWDKLDGSSVSSGQLVTQTISAITTVSGDVVSTYLSSSKNFPSDGYTTVSGQKRGWVLNLYKVGERVVFDIDSINANVRITSTLPNVASCAGGGSANMYILDAQTGNSPSKPVFVGDSGEDIDANNNPTNWNIKQGADVAGVDYGIHDQSTILVKDTVGTGIVGGTTGAVGPDGGLLIPLSEGRVSWRELFQ